MDPTTSALRAEALRRLHAPERRPLVFVNVWDAASARIVEDAGFPAIATGSAGVAYALGYADGQRVPRDEMIAAVQRIARVVRIPVTADVEAGYGDVPATTRGLIEAGAVGLNLEDMEDGTLVPLDAQVARIHAVIGIGRECGVPVVLNARTDIYLAQVGDPATMLARTVERIRAFAAAGADCVFVPGVRDEVTIASLVSSASVPVNILATAGSPSIARMKELGVGRISVGSGPMRAAMALMRRIAVEMRDCGTYHGFTDETVPYPEMQKLFGA